MATVYNDAELFTQKISYLTKNFMQSNTFVDKLSPLAENLIRIFNLDVEDRFELYDAPSGKKVMLLFAKCTQIGYDKVYFTDRFIHQGNTVDVVVLPNDELLKKISNAEILASLNNVYAFILETKKASAEYISPLEITKHVFARYYFKFKYFANAFELDEVTINDLKEDIADGIDNIFTYKDVMDAIKTNIDGGEYFNDNHVFEKLSSEIYYQVIDELYAASEDEEE